MKTIQKRLLAGSILFGCAIMFLMALAGCTKPEKTMEWTPVWEPDASQVQTIEGLSLYVDAQTVYIGSQSVNLIVANDTAESIVIASGTGIEKFVYNCWSVVKKENGPRTAELPCTTIPSGYAVCFPADLSDYVDGLTPGDYRFRIRVLEAPGTEDIYVYHGFSVQPERDNEP